MYLQLRFRVPATSCALIKFSLLVVAILSFPIGSASAINFGIADEGQHPAAGALVQISRLIGTNSNRPIQRSKISCQSNYYQFILTTRCNRSLLRSAAVSTGIGTSGKRS